MADFELGDDIDFFPAELAQGDPDAIIVTSINSATNDDGGAPQLRDNDTSGPEQHMLTCHVVYSAAHQAPMLCLSAATAAGATAAGAGTAVPVLPAVLCAALANRNPQLKNNNISQPQSVTAASQQDLWLGLQNEITQSSAEAQSSQSLSAHSHTFPPLSVLPHPVTETLCVALHPCGGRKLLAPLAVDGDHNKAAVGGSNCQQVTVSIDSRSVTAAAAAAAVRKLGSWLNAVAALTASSDSGVTVRIGVPGVPAELFRTL